jgi:AraC-like DNA-binding protein
MRPTHLKLARGSRTLFEGMMPAGTIHVSGPSQGLVAEFHAPCDFLHLYPTNEYIRRRHDATDPSDFACDLNDLMMRDPVAERLARSLIEEDEFDDDRYAHSVGQTIVMRLLIQCRSRRGLCGTKVSPLAKWRLKRVQDHLDRHAHELVRLADLAAAAGLSRMHFAAQFRAATGYRPHEYLLLRRIERAKELLSNDDMPIVQVALSVGFQGQAHFSTVFRRIAGETPARWRRAAGETSNPSAGLKSLAGGSGPALRQANSGSARGGGNFDER